MRPVATNVQYLYRDYGNWKFWGEFNLKGNFDLNEARKFLFEGEKFIPGEVGIPSLTPEKTNSDDHWLHEIVETSLVSVSVEMVMSANEFMSRLKSAHARGWLQLCPWV